MRAPLLPKIRDTRDKIKPANGFSTLFHVAYRLALPIVIFVLIRLDIGLLPPLLVIWLSKWRIFAVRPRFWPANIRANGVDITVGISAILFMANTETMAFQLLWAALYGVWLVCIKPSSNSLLVSVQAAIGQCCGLMALFIAWGDGPLYGLVLSAGLVCYLAARHFFDSFNEPYAKLLAYIWAYFGAALTWVLGHMLVVYPKQDGLVAQPTLFLVAIGFTLGTIYYLEHFDRLSKLIKRELLFLCASVVVILLISLLYEGAHLIV